MIQGAISCPSISILPDDFPLATSETGLGGSLADLDERSLFSGSFSNLTAVMGTGFQPLRSGLDRSQSEGGQPIRGFGTWSSMSHLPSALEASEKGPGEDLMSYMCRNFANDPSLDLFKGLLHLKDFHAPRKVSPMHMVSVEALPTPPNSPLTSYAQGHQPFIWPSPKSIINKTRKPSSGEKKGVTFNAQVFDLEAKVEGIDVIADIPSPADSAFLDEHRYHWPDVPFNPAQSALQMARGDEDGVDEAYGTMRVPTPNTYSPVHSLIFTNHSRPSTPGSEGSSYCYPVQGSPQYYHSDFPSPPNLMIYQPRAMGASPTGDMGLVGPRANWRPVSHIRTSSGLCSCQVKVQARLVTQRVTKPRDMSLLELDSSLGQIFNTPPLKQPARSLQFVKE